MKSFAAAASLVAITLAAPLARADDPAAAQTLFDEAKALIKEGRYAVACPKLEESVRLAPAIGARFRLADCYENIGRTASAWTNFLGAAAAARTANQPEREREARDRAEKLERRLARVVVVVPDASRVAGLEVTRDRQLVGAAQWGTAVPVDPGEHVVVASAPGKRPYRAQIDIASDASTTKLTIPVLDDLAVAPAPVEPAKCPEPPRSAASVLPIDDAPTRASTSPTLGWVLVGAGGASVAAGVVFWILRGSKVSKLEAECGTDSRACPAGASNDIADGKTYSALGVGLFGLGAVLAGSGVGVLVFGGRDASRPSARVVPMSTAGAHGLGLAGRF